LTFVELFKRDLGNEMMANIAFVKNIACSIDNDLNYAGSQVVDGTEYAVYHSARSDLMPTYNRSQTFYTKTAPDGTNCIPVLDAYDRYSRKFGKSAAPHELPLPLIV
jgi:hypothetical protein